MCQTKRDTADNIIPLLLQSDWTAITGAISTPCNTRIQTIKQKLCRKNGLMFIRLISLVPRHEPSHEKKNNKLLTGKKWFVFICTPVKRFWRGVRGRKGWEIPQNPLLQRVEKFPLKITTDNIETPEIGTNFGSNDTR